MGLCVKCKKFLPPGFLVEKEDGDLLCLFCERDVTEIKYGEHNEKTVNKDTVLKEYERFLKIARADSEVLKKVAKGEESAPRTIII